MPTYYRGKDATLYVVVGGTETRIGYAQSASVEINPNPERLFEVGSPLAVGIEMGNVEISGSISRIWMDNFMLQKLGMTTPALSAFDLVFKIGTEEDAPAISLTGCVVSTGSIDIPQDGWIMGDIDFMAKSYTLLGRTTQP